MSVEDAFYEAARSDDHDASMAPFERFCRQVARLSDAEIVAEIRRVAQMHRKP